METNEKRPNRVEIRCKIEDGFVREFKNLYDKIKLNYNIVVEDREDIQVSFFLDDELLDIIGLPHEVKDGTTTV